MIRYMISKISQCGVNKVTMFNNFPHYDVVHQYNLCIESGVASGIDAPHYTDTKNRKVKIRSSKQLNTMNVNSIHSGSEKKKKKE